MKNIYLVASGDLRIAANQKCQEAQAAMEKQVTQAIEREGWTVVRAHGFDPKKKHGFIDSQKYGMQVFKDIGHGHDIRPGARTSHQVELDDE